MRNERALIGVIGTEIHSSEQQQIVKGIILQAQQMHADVAVLSNLFNPLEPERAGCCENQVYRLALSPAISALIMISESFVNEDLRERILQILKQRTDIPVILVGASLPGFEFPHINTSDANDIEEITAHLIEAHGYRDIALLTGPLSLEVSKIRLQGYRKALEMHGIPFDPAKIHEGDFWYTSGKALADAWFSGEKPMPQALVCQNDYMAFGVLDAFEERNVSLLDNIAVTGYEFIPERHLHTPLLTTYQRSRIALGRQTVEAVMDMLHCEPMRSFQPPKGRLIAGMSCPCSLSDIRQHEELMMSRLEKQYADWNLKSDLDRLLTECTDMDAFADALGKDIFLLRGVSDCFLCLSEDWFRQEPCSEILICRNVNPWADHTVFRLHQNDLAGIFQRVTGAAACYWLPLCFHNRLFGYCVLKYDAPERYDDVCRSWIKSVANGLEFLRLKADVRYLLQCRTLSVSYDSMTGMFSADGLKSAYQLMQNAPDDPNVTAVILYCPPVQELLLSAEQTADAVNQLIAAAKVLQRFQNGSICGRISEYAFLLLIPTDTVSPELFVHAVSADLLHDLPADAFLCAGKQFSCKTDADALIQTMNETAEQLDAQRTESRMQAGFSELHEIRDAIYREPAAKHDLNAYAAMLGYHTDYFNRKYKKCFRSSFHQDCIYSRIMYAAHLLMHSALTVSETAERCGYAESKYFIRQFSAVTGYPPKAFREAVGRFCGL